VSDRYIIRTTGQTGPGIEAHLADTTDAHDASAISFSATGNLSSTDVQAAIAELDSEKAAVAEPIAAAHIADTSDAHDASAISVLDTAGNYTATDVEAVLAELPSRFVASTGGTFSVTGSNKGPVIDCRPVNKHALIIKRWDSTGGSLPTGWDVATTVNSQGAWHTNAWMVISGTLAGSPDSEGVYLPRAADAAKSTMLSVWSDVNSAAVEIRPAAASSGNRCLDILDTSANIRLALEFTGQLSWGASTYAALDTFLSRTAAGRLRVESLSSTDASLAVNSPAGNPNLRLERNGATAFTIVGAGTDQARFEVGSTATMRMYALSSIPRVCIGVDDATAVFVSGTPNAGLPAGKFMGASGQAVDILRVTDNSSNVLHRFNKAGYSVTAKTTAPADADLSTNELAMWFDSTAGAAKAMFKGKNASGTVVTGSVTLS
jgi:hypothetical protein